MYLRYNKLKDFVKNIILEQFSSYENQKSYGADLSYYLLESYNIDGVYFYSDYEATEFIKEYFNDFDEVVDELKFQLGAESIPNVFSEPDRFCVVCFLEIASYLLSKCNFVDKNWNNLIELNKKNITIIKKELEEV